MIVAPFRINYEVTVLCEGMETVDDETAGEARETIAREIAKGFRQVEFDVKWDIPDWTIEEVGSDGD